MILSWVVGCKKKNPLVAGSVVFVPESLPYGSDHHETQLFDINPADWVNTVENQRTLSEECHEHMVSAPPCQSVTSDHGRGHSSSDASLPSDAAKSDHVGATSGPQVRSLGLHSQIGNPILQASFIYIYKCLSLSLSVSFPRYQTNIADPRCI